ncbi:MAG: nitrate reductase associated protein [Thermosynechococcaceae cyanobacterium MS004]|nr:nitrate reductase associated protein [Thermosynechococcaceae cyanobacterium MS004]
MEPVFFKFESDFIASLRCIPMIVRYKLDICGIKLKLEQWSQFSQSDRHQLAVLPCDHPEEIAHYRQALCDLIEQRTQTQPSELPIEVHPAWTLSDHIPVPVLEKAAAVGVPFSLDQWRSLTPLQRFALIKLSRSSHENRNFKPALQEFQQ